MDPTIALLKTPHHYAKWIYRFVNNASSTFTSAAKSLTLWWFFMAFCPPSMYVYFADTRLEMVFSSLVHIPIALVQS
jgi:hypothetical protein